MKFRDFNRFTVNNSQNLSIPLIIGVFKSHGDYFDLQVEPGSFVSLESYPADPFLELPESPYAFVSPFRQDNQPIFIPEHINSFIEYFIIPFQAAEAVPHPVDRQHLQEIE